MNKLPLKLSRLLVLSLTSLCTPAHAFDLLVNGFGTVCASKSDLAKSAYYQMPSYPFPTQINTQAKNGVAPYVSNVYYRPSYDGAERRWNFLPNSKFGLQFSSLFNDKFKAVVQIVGRAESMTSNHYYAKFDWAYLQYNPTNELDFQFGRFRLPSFYYSDYLDVNHAQPWVIPPEEVYFIVGGAFRNMDGIKARYAYYWGNWTINPKLWFGSMEEQLSILQQSITVSVRDVIGAQLEIENDYFSIQGSLMRSIYDTTLNDSMQGLVSTVLNLNNTNGTNASVQPATNLNAYLQDKNSPIIYIGLALHANVTDNFELLFERASIFSRGIITTAREGWYGTATYSFCDKYALSLTYGFTRPLHTEVNKYNALANFFSSPLYTQNVYDPYGAGKATVALYQSYLGKQRSIGVDLRYDILPSLALKGAVKYIIPIGQKGYTYKYLFNHVQTNKAAWVYRVSFDFVF